MSRTPCGENWDDCFRCTKKQCSASEKDWTSHEKGRNPERPGAVTSKCDALTKANGYYTPIDPESERNNDFSRFLNGNGYRWPWPVGKALLAKELNRIATERLTEKQRQALALRFGRGLTFEEMGKRANVSDVSMNKLVRNALKNMEKGLRADRKWARLFDGRIANDVRQ
jgi:hypothetical protein